jgi:protein-L-isoaspartate(D-aspartate) O-methyltransferase
MLVDLEERGITDRCVLAAMSVVPREWFPSPPDAYRLARMLQELQLDPSDTVLELGTGDGYAAAVTSQLVHHVYSVERDPIVALRTRDRLATLGFDGIDVRSGELFIGWPEHAPYNVVIVHQGAVPHRLYRQLAVGGRIAGDAWRDACSLRSA